MTDRPDFEKRLEARLRARAALASRPFDAGAIAHRAVAISGRRWTPRLEWPSSRPAWARLIVGLLLAVALLGAIVAGVGALLREHPPLPPSGVVSQPTTRSSAARAAKRLPSRRLTGLSHSAAD